MSKRGLILSCDDACQSDVRFAELAKAYDFDAVFYWPVEWHSLAYAKGYEPLHYEDAVAIAEHFEIGGHSVTHRLLTDLKLPDAIREVEDCKVMLEDLFDTHVTKFAPPRGYTYEELTKAVLEVFEEQRLTYGKHLVHIHPSSGANGYRPWRECINEHTRELWCHSWELDKYNLWDELEAFLKEYRSENPHR